jgi:hypothetical protein
LLSQDTAHEPLVQVACPFDVGSGQAEQRVPQDPALVSERHMPLHRCVVDGHMPLQAWVLSMQAPLHSLAPGQAGAQLTPSQLTVPPAGAAQALQDVAPQFATLSFFTHLPPHGCHPLLHCRAHEPDWQTALPLGSLGHIAQLEPQAVALSSAAQVEPHL